MSQIHWSYRSHLSHPPLGRHPARVGGRRGLGRRARVRRRGVVIVVVAVVVLLISLAALGFLLLMQMENKAAMVRGDQLQAESVAASGSDYLAAILEAPRDKRPPRADRDDVPDLFAGILVDGEADEDVERQGRFSIFVAMESQDAAQTCRFGYENESAKLNLAQLVAWDRRRPGWGRQALMNLPAMDESTADAMLDWIDRDREARDFGAEADYYAGLDPPRRPRDGTPSSLEELLLARGVTREKLLGLDLNGDFRVDSWESERARSQASAAASGASAGAGDRHVPWSRFLTLYSGERDESADGRPRVQLNEADLGKLHRELTSVLEPTWANFIVAYRQFGPFSGSGSAEDPSQLVVDLSHAAKFPLQSPLDLIGARVAIPDDSANPSGANSGAGSAKSEKPKRIVASPFTTDPVRMRDYLPTLMDRVTVGDGRPLYGRVNINLAPREVLRGVPGIDTAVAERIVSARDVVSSDHAARRHAVWLLAEQIVDLAAMKQLERYVTTGGDVARAHVVGYYDDRAPIVRFEVVLDATERPARQLYYKDLRRLGRQVPEDVTKVSDAP
ncbi:MAG: hypothetical protein FJ276_03370 [Planctomycetes bacterium]|nr:hypothetical protein [Planctomycetota bacterium]